ncbi:MAG TPA: hypothetical protein ENJ08_00875 [Gammaproteobacteria bacterium]|nr:hypothetical protein [Gammaproteobacteria bacterium]
MKRISFTRSTFILANTLVLSACSSPDLYVKSNSLSPNCPGTSDSITFTTEIKNRGNSTAGASTMSFRIGGESSPPTYPVPSLSAGATHTVQRTLTLNVAQNYQNTIRVDINNNVSESRENNNESKLFYTVVPPGDRVCLTNVPTGEKGILVDGQFSTGFQNDRTFISNNQAIPVGNVVSGTNNEVVAYAKNRPVALQENAGWTNSNDDNVEVAMQNLIRIPVKVWIVRGPFNTQKQLALDAFATTQSIWEEERMGVEFESFTIVDATGNSNASSYHDFTCADKTNMENDIGKTTGMINIYYVNRVDNGTGRGQACSIGSDFVAMGSSTGDELLAHEIGHDFALTHTNGQANYNQTNVMHNASNTREFFAEGQTFRAHLSADSALNSIYAARPGQPTRNCPQATSNNVCPRNDKRIWADGTFPAN